MSALSKKVKGLTLFRDAEKLAFENRDTRSYLQDVLYPKAPFPISLGSSSFIPVCSLHRVVSLSPIGAHLLRLPVSFV